jgi:hypothetical protein
MNKKRRLMENDELSHQMLHDYEVVSREVIRHLGSKTPVTSLGPADSELLICAEN